MKKNNVVAIIIFPLILGFLFFNLYSNKLKKENIAASLEQLKVENKERRQELIDLVITLDTTEQLENENISRILNHNHDQAGVSSESILVSSAGKIVSVSRYGYDTSKEKVMGFYLEKALAGESGNIIEPDYGSIPALIVYSPVEINNETFAILTLMDLTEAEMCAGGCEN
ncbi:MAG: hypothetical protein OEM02_11300 [Desulfobulbaceae bacterium]|nr:hypothetical protein [Desulfobulbaceae bacterium]